MTKPLFFLLLFVSAGSSLRAQDSVVTKPKKDWSKINLATRAKDHLLIQLGSLKWNNTPDSINTSGIPRSFNLYVLLDFPFKTDPRFSVALGAGIATDNMYFSKTDIDIAGKRANRLSFRNVSDSTYFKKVKLATAYLEAPVELRFMSQPDDPNHSIKAVLGIKVGTLLSATVKGKNLLNSSGTLLNAYTSKEKSKRYFNSTRISITGRVGYGIFSLFASYQLNSFVKDGFGPDVRPFTLGLSICGL